MSPAQYEKFYWPSLRKLLIGLVDAGLTPLPFFQGDYTVRLPYLKELPKGKVPLHFDMVDRKEARRILGDHQCFWSNIPSSLMVAGTPQQVADDVKALIDLFAGSGGLIIDISTALPDEAKPENIEAMVKTAREYGNG